MTPRESSTSPGTQQHFLLPRNAFILSDGITVYVSKNNCDALATGHIANADGTLKRDENGELITYQFYPQCATIYVDVNGSNKPNQFGYDVFAVTIYKDYYKFLCSSTAGCVENVIKYNKFYDGIVDYELDDSF